MGTFNFLILPFLDVTIEFQTEDVTVSESDGSFTACLTKNNNSAVTFNVTVSSIADSALNGTGEWRGETTT